MIIRILQSIRNTIDYSLRQLFRWSRKKLRLSNEEKQQLFDDLSHPLYQCAVTKESEFRHRYHFEEFYSCSKRKTYRINLYYLDLLEKSYDQSGSSFPENIIAADLGCAQWFYVRALYSFYRFWICPGGRPVELEGFEVDAYRVYNDFYSRYDYAMAYRDGLEGAIYHPNGFRLIQNRYNFITMFFPFIFMKDHLEWGLPQPLFQPKRLFSDAWNSLCGDGRLLIVNQGVDEHREQMNIIDECGFRVKSTFDFTSPFYRYQHSHHVILLEKNHA